jgi:hypothetical protein
MAQYLMLLWENPASFAGIAPGDLQQVIQEYVAWRKLTASRSALGPSAKLRDEGGKRIKGSGGSPVVADGPYSEAHEVIGGFFTIEAPDYDAAVAIASTCPHVKYGWIELREIEPTPG